MLTLGVLGLTGYCREKMKTEHERAWKEAIRRQCRISVTCEKVTSEDVHDDTVDHLQTNPPDNKDLLHFSMELLNQSAEQVFSILHCELVRLTWANRTVLKGRIVVLNAESRYLDSLLRRAAGEEVGGFVFCSEGEQPLQTDQLEAYLQRIQNAYKGMSLASVPPVWHVFGITLSSVMAVDSKVRIIDIHEGRPQKEEVFFLPGAGESHYTSAWLPDVVTQSLSKNGTMSTLNNLENFWTWLTTEVNIEDHETKQDVAARMHIVDLYNETRYLC